MKRPRQPSYRRLYSPLIPIAIFQLLIRRGIAVSFFLVRLEFLFEVVFCSVRSLKHQFEIRITYMISAIV